ncbi:MAG TPA: hypothetical protein VK826_05480 [Bacteroidia bacterium]|nr:hypothetical protein [Bacteroidia bacterium]
MKTGEKNNPGDKNVNQGKNTGNEKHPDGKKPAPKAEDQPWKNPDPTLPERKHDPDPTKPEKQEGPYGSDDKQRKPEGVKKNPARDESKDDEDIGDLNEQDIDDQGIADRDDDDNDEIGDPEEEEEKQAPGINQPKRHASTETPGKTKAQDEQHKKSA